MGKLYCSATHCHNYSGKEINGRKVTLHRFPGQKRLRSIWVSRVSRKNWRPTTCSRLCSEHFVTKSGPTKEHPLPSEVNHRVFRTTNYMSSHDAACLETEENSSESDHGQNTRNITELTDSNSEAENTSCILNESFSQLDNSVMFHDYCGNVHVSDLSKVRNKEIQCETEESEKESQTETNWNESNSCACSTNRLVNTDTSVNLPMLVIEDLTNEDVTFYTGLPDKANFYLLFEHIMSERKSVNPDLGGRPRKLRDVDEFLMVLMRLRLGLLTQDLARRFNISLSTCINIFNEWLDIMYEHLHFLVAWPDRATVKNNMPESFQSLYPNCRVIIDCTEIFTETPQSLGNKSRMYSDYKSHMTWKVLIGISPNGTITHVSDLWAGSISDKEITKLSGLIAKCEPGDAIMADKGFVIADLVTPKGIYLIVPPTKRNGKLSKRQVEKTRRIANLRIHVERAIQRIKNFRIIQGVVPISMHERVSRIVFVICALCNLLPPLIQG